MVKHFSGTKIEGMKHVKSTQEKQHAQIIIHIGTNDLLGNKNADKIANENSRIHKFNQNKRN